MISAETWNLRQQILRKYGGQCTCRCGCRESNLRRLQLHHANGGGTKERQSVRGSTHYVRLLAKPVDKSLTPLCVGCHWEETMFEICHGGLSPENRKELVQINDGGQPDSSEPRQEPGVSTRDDAWPDPYEALKHAPPPQPPPMRVIKSQPSWWSRLWWKLFGVRS
jgi:hypothetical protein